MVFQTLVNRGKKWKLWCLRLFLCKLIIFARVQQSDRESYLKCLSSVLVGRIFIFGDSGVYIYVFGRVLTFFSLPLCVFYCSSAYSVSVSQVFLRFVSLSGAFPLIAS